MFPFLFSFFSLLIFLSAFHVPFKKNSSCLNKIQTLCPQCSTVAHSMKRLYHLLNHRLRTLGGYFPNSLRPISYLRYILVRSEKQSFLWKKQLNDRNHEQGTHRAKMGTDYSIVKDSSADLGVNSKIVQIRPTVKAVCTKISYFFAYLSIFCYF